MSAPVRELSALLAGLAPERRPGAFVFDRRPAAEVDGPALDTAVAMVREAEGVTLVRPASGDAPGAMAMITLTVTSALDAVGLTAAVATALAGRAIPCNVIAGACHDHLFVPVAQADAALEALDALQALQALSATAAPRALVSPGVER